MRSESRDTPETETHTHTHTHTRTQVTTTSLSSISRIVVHTEVRTREGKHGARYMVHSTSCTVHEASHPRVVAHRPRRSKRAGPRRSAACRARPGVRQRQPGSCPSPAPAPPARHWSQALRAALSRYSSSRSRKVRSPLPGTSKSWTSTSCGARSLNNGAR